jgi:hypothetical protein
MERGEGGEEDGGGGGVGRPSHLPHQGGGGKISAAEIATSDAEKTNLECTCAIAQTKMGR